jgi:surface protein
MNSFLKEEMNEKTSGEEHTIHPTQQMSEEEEKFKTAFVDVMENIMGSLGISYEDMEKVTKDNVKETGNRPSELYCTSDCAVCGVQSTLKCGKCLTVFYCCAEHQTQDWPTHKLTCKLLRSNSDIQAAVNLWCTNSTKALKKYGHISEWNTSKVTTMNELFLDKKNFKDNISKWDVKNVIDMHFMFCGASSFVGDVSLWNVSKVKDMSGMFCDSLFNGDISRWNVSNVKCMNGMFAENKAFNVDISDWNVSKVSNMKMMFYMTTFNGDISRWNVSNVRDMSSMFLRASLFQGDLSRWNVGNVNNMGYTFSGAHRFNSDISSWNVSNVTDMTLI